MVKDVWPYTRVALTNQGLHFYNCLPLPQKLLIADNFMLSDCVPNFSLIAQILVCVDLHKVYLPPQP